MQLAYRIPLKITVLIYKYLNHKIVYFVISIGSIKYNSTNTHAEHKCTWCRDTIGHQHDASDDSEVGVGVTVSAQASARVTTLTTDAGGTVCANF